MLPIAREEQEKSILAQFETVSVLRCGFCDNVLGQAGVPEEELAMRAYRVGWRWRYEKKLCCPRCTARLGWGVGREYASFEEERKPVMQFVEWIEKVINRNF
jgi:hypothetical protein